jgi:RNA polymerase sigma-70 factor (ECF subfamily)
MSHALVQEIGQLRPDLLKFAMLHVRNAAYAEDAVQDALVAAIEGIGTFARGSSLRTWVTGILKYKIVDSMRASAREESLNYDEHLLQGSDPEQGLARRRVVEAVEASLKQLPSCAARVFVLREVMGMDTAEVCKELAISSSNCWVMHHRVRMRLRACPTIRNLAADAI